MAKEMQTNEVSGKEDAVVKEQISGTKGASMEQEASMEEGQSMEEGHSMDEGHSME